MTYCDVTALRGLIGETRLVELTDDARTGTVDTAVVDAAIVASSAEIDGYCSGRYGSRLRVPPVPGMIVDLCSTLTVYRLYLRRERVPEEWQSAADRARTVLSDVARGTVNLDNSARPEDFIRFTTRSPEERRFRDPRGYR